MSIVESDQDLYVNYLIENKLVMTEEEFAKIYPVEDDLDITEELPKIPVEHFNWADEVEEEELRTASTPSTAGAPVEEPKVVEPQVKPEPKKVKPVRPKRTPVKPVIDEEGFVWVPKGSRSPRAPTPVRKAAATFSTSVFQALEEEDA
jgi:hypothetical protein